MRAQGAYVGPPVRVRDHWVWYLRIFRERGERYVIFYGVRFYLPDYISSTFEFGIPYTDNHPPRLPESWRRDL